MKLPELNNVANYVGLYVIDFGDHCAVGYTAAETACLLESERYADVKVFRIHRAMPDGTMELKGITNDRFKLESGMFFHCNSEAQAKADFDTLAKFASQSLPPCNAKLQLAHDTQGNQILGLIYPAEYEDDISSWMLKSGFKGSGAVDAGISQVTRFYNNGYCINKSCQLTAATAIPARSFAELASSTSQAVQRAM
ncbi:MAG: hypothetical protein JW745_04125 [Sedimentisphaerales bacterium]|nr:hypothetical protein [Sedimentisphaerales bacterium]MBN2841849.1 hypothetical protein [Sedimentisphaerales bacterium]